MIKCDTCPLGGVNRMSDFSSSEIPNSSDCISRQATLDTIMGQPPEPHYPSWYAAQIEKLPAAQPEKRWIPCSERLPKV